MLKSSQALKWNTIYLWHVMQALSLMNDAESAMSIVYYAINIGREKQRFIKTVLENG